MAGLNLKDLRISISDQSELLLCKFKRHSVEMLVKELPSEAENFGSQCLTVTVNRFSNRLKMQNLSILLFCITLMLKTSNIVKAESI